MPNIQPSPLRTIAAHIFTAVGTTEKQARALADALVDANLAGHDSHGVMRIPDYVNWAQQGLVNLKAELKIVNESDAFAVVDGDWGWGQALGRDAMEVAIAKAIKSGVATVFGRRCMHMGRMGDYPAMAAQRGLAATMFVNTHGAGSLVAPFGGIERRLSANPIAMGLPRSTGAPIVVDVSTCTIAEGKVRNMFTAGKPTPEGAIIDSEGRPTTDASKLYGPPVGALLPVGGHKGFALGLAADILAGALSGAGCTREKADRVGNGFMVTVVDIERVLGREAYDAEVDALVKWIKSSKLAPGFTEILLPGEPEAREQQRREKEGIPIHEATWQRLLDTATKLGVTTPAGVS